MDPTNLDEMCKKVVFFDQVKATLPATLASLGPIDERFRILEKYEVEVPVSVSAVHAQMSGKLEAFDAAVATAEEKLTENKKKFKAQLLRDSDELSRKVDAFRDEFLEKVFRLTSAVTINRCPQWLAGGFRQRK